MRCCLVSTSSGSFSHVLHVLSVKDTIMSSEHPIRNDEQTDIVSLHL